jgi:hypothetical protein
MSSALIGVQVHGGMGFIEETGRGAVHARRAHHDNLRGHDRYPGERPHRSQARLAIGGAAMRALTRDVRAELARVAGRRCGHGGHQAVGHRGGRAAARGDRGPREGATPPARSARLRSRCPISICAASWPGGWLLAKSAALALARRGGGEREFYEGKLETARFYAQQVLPRSLALARTVQQRGARVSPSADAALI